jgi:tripartite-type tricarboxylate transporter receptor subunit TctC
LADRHIAGLMTLPVQRRRRMKYSPLLDPRKAPDNVAAILKASLDRALNDETFRAPLEKIGYSVKRPQSAAKIIRFIAADRARWSAVVKARNISLD